MEKSKSFYCLLIYLIVSVSGRSLDSYNNETQYQCFTDDSCSQHDNIRLYNQKVYCCRPSHTLIFKLMIDNTVMESFSLQTGGGLENEAQAGKPESPHQAKPESSHQGKIESPHQSKINEVDSVTYSVVEVQDDLEDGDHKIRSASPSTDEHFPTTLYFDLKKNAQGRLVKRHLNMRQDNFKVIRTMQGETTAGGKRLSHMRAPQTEATHGKSKAVTMCVCDKTESRGFMDFLFNFLQSLCQESWI